MASTLCLVWSFVIICCDHVSQCDTIGCRTPYNRVSSLLSHKFLDTIFPFPTSIIQTISTSFSNIFSIFIFLYSQTFPIHFVSRTYSFPTSCCDYHDPFPHSISFIIPLSHFPHVLFKQFPQVSPKCFKHICIYLCLATYTPKCFPRLSILMNNYLVRSYRDVIVVTKIATRRASKVQSVLDHSHFPQVVMTLSLFSLIWGSRNPHILFGFVAAISLPAL